MNLFNCKYLPSANEVGGKVIFSQAYVIPSVRGRGGVGFRTCITGHMTGESASKGESAAMMAWAVPPSDTMGYGQQSGGTHSTGMHSCLVTEFSKTRMMLFGIHDEVKVGFLLEPRNYVDIRTDQGDSD